MAKTPVVQSLRQNAAFLTGLSNGDFFFACGRGAYRNGEWRGFGRYDATNGRVTMTDASITGPIALAGQLLLGVNGREPTLVDFAGSTQKTFAHVDDNLGEFDGAVANPAGTEVLLLCRRGAVRLDLSRGTSRPITGVSGAGYALDGELLLLSHTARRATLTRGSGKKSEKRDVPTTDNIWGQLTQRGDLVLAAGGQVIDLKKKTMTNLSEHGSALTWSPNQATIVRARPSGVVEVLNGQGTVIRSFARPRGGYLLSADTAGHFFICTTGTFIERYDLQAGARLPTERAARKKPSPRKPIVARALDPRTGDLLSSFFNNPEDTTPLKVWADTLSEAGDPRGEFVQLCLVENPTPAQSKRLEALRRLKGELVGPARDFLRRWSFSSEGLVERATCEAQKLVEGLDAIVALGPQLRLDVTSLSKRTKATVAALAKLSLGRLRCLDLGQNRLSDTSLETLANALVGVEELHLDGNDDLTVRGLRALQTSTLKRVRLSQALAHDPEVRAHFKGVELEVGIG